MYVLKALGPHQISAILRRALEDRERGLGALGIAADDDALAGLARYANGDARVALNMLDTAAALRRPAPSGSISRSSPTSRRTARCSTTRAARSTTT